MTQIVVFSQVWDPGSAPSNVILTKQGLLAGGAVQWLTEHLGNGQAAQPKTLGAA